MSLRPTKNNNGIRDGSNMNGYKPSTELSSSLLHSYFDYMPLYQSTKIILGANLFGLIITLLQPDSHWHVDLLGTGAFALSALPALMTKDNPRIFYSSFAVTLWSVKLASFLLYRVMSLGHDERLRTILATPSSAIGFWIISAAWGIICSSPHTIGATAIHATGNSLLIQTGGILFMIGWLMETVADYQKWTFKQQLSPAALHKFCDSGLWSISQHPNWFGNLVLWLGIFTMNLSTFIDPAPTSKSRITNVMQSVFSFLWRFRRLAVAAIGPLFMWLLFNAQATGFILGDALQATYERYGYGKDPAYTKYIDTTPAIVPNFPLLIVQWIRRSKF
jgi:steroid 5-alpha reductase family enzyme